MDGTAAGTRRLFFALWPGEDVSEALSDIGRKAHALAGGRLMRRDTLHLTLAFLGDVAADKLSLAKSVAEGMAGQGFELVVDRLGLWRHNHIVWAGPTSVPTGLLTLAEDLARALTLAGFGLEKQSYSPHITLLRKAMPDVALPDAMPIHWPVRDFVMVESKRSATGAHYEVVGRWPLSA